MARPASVVIIGLADLHDRPQHVACGFSPVVHLDWAIIDANRTHLGLNRICGPPTVARTAAKDIFDGDLDPRTRTGTRLPFRARSLRDRGHDRDHSRSRRSCRHDGKQLHRPFARSAVGLVVPGQAIFPLLGSGRGTVFFDSCTFCRSVGTLSAGCAFWFRL
jgi:hypothetical protein